MQAWSVDTERTEAALKTHGFGLSSVRFICGTQDKHLELEDRITQFHGTEATILCGPPGRYSKT